MENDGCLGSVAGKVGLGVLAATVLLGCLYTLASEPAGEVARVVVISETAPMGVGSQVKHELQLGEILDVGKKQGDFYWIPSRHGWIRHGDAVPLSDARGLWTAELNAAPNAKLYLARGKLLATLGEEDSALQDFTAAIEQDPNLVGAWINRGNLWRGRGELERARHDFDQAIELDVDNDVAYHNRALVWADQRAFDQAIQDVSHALELNPKLVQAYVNRGVFWREKQQYRKAIADYDAALRLQPEFALAYANRGFALKQLSEFSSAIEDYQRALHIEPELAQAHNDLAWLLATCPREEFRDGRQAVAHARKACELTEFEVWNYLDTLGAAYAQAGDFKNAVQWGRKACELSSESTRAACEARLKVYETGKPFSDSEPMGANDSLQAPVEQ